MRKKRIAFFSQPLVVGGIEKVLLNILSQLPNDEFDVILYLPFSGVWDDKIPENVHVVYLFSHHMSVGMMRKICSIFLLLPNFVIRKLLRWKGVGDDFSAVVAFTEWLQPAVAALLGKKIGWIHVMYPEDILQRGWKKRITTWLRRRIWKRFDRFFCVSKATREEFVKVSGCDTQARVLYNPINEEEIRKLAQAFPVEKKNGVYRYVACGRLTYQKGFDLLIEAFAQQDHASNSLELMMVGSGEDKAMLESLVNKYGLTGKVVFCGRQDNPYPYIASADAFVCSSRFEGYGLVVAEALVLGIPVLSTRCSGPEELLDFGKRGLLVEGNISGLSAGLKFIRNQSDGADNGKLLPVRNSEYDSFFDDLSKDWL